MAQHWKYGAELRGGCEHSIQVQTDSASADFNLLVLAADGSLLAADRGPEPGAECTIRAGQPMQVVVVVELVKGSGSFSMQVSSQPLRQTQSRQAQSGQTQSQPRRQPQPRRQTRPSGRSQSRSGDVGSELTVAEAEGLVAAHNEWRKRYGVAPLQWSTELAEYAQQWADELERTGMQMRHRSPNNFGENLYWCSGRPATPKAVVDAWGDEDKLYDYEANDWWPNAGHFSQVVWHDTTEVGGAVVRHGGQELWVCNYNPRGNWTGKRPFTR